MRKKRAAAVRRRFIRWPDRPGGDRDLPERCGCRGDTKAACRAPNGWWGGRHAAECVMSLGCVASVAAVAEEAEQVEEEVDEVEVEAQRAECGELACGFKGRCGGPLFDLLCVPCGKAYEY